MVNGCPSLSVEANFSSFVTWGTYYTPRGSLAVSYKPNSGPIQFRRGAIGRSVDATDVPPADTTRAFCLGFGPRCEQGPSRTLRYTAKVGGSTKLVALVQYFDAPVVGQAVKVWSWNLVRT
jgi:hypothetical protein